MSTSVHSGGFKPASLTLVGTRFTYDYSTGDIWCCIFDAKRLSRPLPLHLDLPDVPQYYPQSTVPDMVKMAEKQIPGVVMNHKREWRQWKRDLDEGRGEDGGTKFKY